MSAHKADEGQSASKFIQICASQNDLFALDEAGSIYQYNFTATTWEKLVAARSTASPDAQRRLTGPAARR
jgi:hypothetical protein